MIVVGYQGIGKSTIAGTNRCIDLESGNFYVDGKRPDDWYKIYCQIANHLSEQGYIVFTSSHKVVRDELRSSKETVVVMYPSLSLKDQWIKKLHDRFVSTGLDKDFRAYMNAKEMYDENIKDLSRTSFRKCEIININYSMKTIIENLVYVNPFSEVHLINNDVVLTS